MKTNNQMSLNLIPESIARAEARRLACQEGA